MNYLDWFWLTNKNLLCQNCLYKFHILWRYRKVSKWVSILGYRYLRLVSKTRYRKVLILKMGIVVRYRKVSIPEFGIKTRYRKLSIPEKDINTQNWKMIMFCIMQLKKYFPQLEVWIFHCYTWWSKSLSRIWSKSLK